ncbi:uncharacterized protein IWZ02DRAFT_494409 [Phyllosticta citriasiana]|uniref:BTB domain-containing protein n=1 Tax=Phyllosticta citriasiana TaxID=595635 RepID=A0ABR1KCC3_9PEZI
MESSRNPFGPPDVSYWEDVESFGVLKMVTILVGPNAKPYVVHANVVGGRSPFFKAAFENGFKESATQIMTLADTTEAAFRVVMEWAYFRWLPCYSLAETDDWDEFCAGRKELRWVNMMVNVYVFAETYSFQKLANIICKDLVWRLWEVDIDDPQQPCFPFYATDTINRLFNNVPENSELWEQLAIAFLKRL